MDAAIAGLLGALGGAVVGGIGSFAATAQASKDETERQHAALASEQKRVESQIQHERELDARDDLRRAIDAAVDAASEFLDKYTRVLAYMAYHEKHPEVDPGSAYRKEQEDLLSRLRDWRKSRTLLWLRLPDKTPLKAATARFDLAIVSFHEKSNLSGFTGSFSDAIATEIRDELSSAITDMEESAYGAIQ